MKRYKLGCIASAGAARRAETRPITVEEIDREPNRGIIVQDGGATECPDCRRKLKLERGTHAE
jgi:hypothetical protein